MVRQLYTASTGGSKESMQVGQNHREINLVTQQNKKVFFFFSPQIHCFYKCKIF